MSHPKKMSVQTKSDPATVVSDDAQKCVGGETSSSGQASNAISKMLKTNNFTAPSKPSGSSLLLTSNGNIQIQTTESGSSEFLITSSSTVQIQIIDTGYSEPAHDQTTTTLPCWYHLKTTSYLHALGSSPNYQNLENHWDDLQILVERYVLLCNEEATFDRLYSTLRTTEDQRRGKELHQALTDMLDTYNGNSLYAKIENIETGVKESARGYWVNAMLQKVLVDFIFNDYADESPFDWAMGQREGLKRGGIRQVKSPGVQSIRISTIQAYVQYYVDPSSTNNKNPVPHFTTQLTNLADKLLSRLDKSLELLTAWPPRVIVHFFHTEMVTHAIFMYLLIHGYLYTDDIVPIHPGPGETFNFWQMHVSSEYVQAKFEGKRVLGTKMFGMKSKVFKLEEQADENFECQTEVPESEYESASESQTMDHGHDEIDVEELEQSEPILLQQFIDEASYRDAQLVNGEVRDGPWKIIKPATVRIWGRGEYEGRC